MVEPNQQIAAELPAPQVAGAAASDARKPRALSYKFQRLRERLRQAIASGELAGKLPGERELAKRFGVNAKTLSKALTDLAAEGVLDRSIGRGTFVRGSAEAEQSTGTAGRWLLVCEPHQLGWMLLQHIRAANPDCQTVTSVANLRPSFISPFRAVIIMAANVPADFVRDLLVRGIPVVDASAQPGAYSTNAVMLDRPLAIATLGRELVLGGHRRLVAVEPRGRSGVYDALRTTVLRYAPDADVDRALPEEGAQAVLAGGATALVCSYPPHATRIVDQLRDAGVDVPGQASVAAIGCIRELPPPCSGYFITASEKAAAILRLLQDRPLRPVTLWLAGRMMDAATMTARPASEDATAAAAATAGASTDHAMTLHAPSSNRALSA